MKSLILATLLISSVPAGCNAVEPDDNEVSPAYLRKGALSLVEPADGAVLATPRPTFRWNPRSRARVQICMDPTCTTVVQELSGHAGAAIAEVDLGPGTYFWRAVRVVGRGQVRPPWSVTRGFAVVDAGADTFRATGLLAQRRSWHAAALLPDGRVLIVGGIAPDTFDWLQSAEIYDPALETFETSAPTGMIHKHPRATALADGRVLVTGSVASPEGWLPQTELFDPVTETFTPGPDTLVVHDQHTATILASGHVLVASTSAEAFVPTSDTFGSVSPMNVMGQGHEAVRLADERVLLSGGPHPSSSGGGTRTEAELFLPDSWTFALTGDMNVARAEHTITALPDGRALVTGGYIGLGGPIEVYESAELYDATAGTFALTGQMTTSRSAHTATLLPSGLVLLAGGTTDFGAVGDPSATIGVTATADLYNPTTGTFAATSAPMETPRRGHTATRLGDGRVLIVGGTDSTATPTAELYAPATP